jgi:hypothetical protein
MTDPSIGQGLRNRIAGLADHLPAPRDKAARALLRAAKDLAMGRDPAVRERAARRRAVRRMVAKQKPKNDVFMHVPPGHFYSPIVDVHEVKTRGSDTDEWVDLPGIDVDLAAYAEVWAEWLPHARRWEEGAGSADRRYHTANSMFGAQSARLLAGAIGAFRPRRYVEIGSGFSSAVLLDINEEWRSEDPIELTFIEPNPQRLQSILRDSDRAACTIIEEKVQNVDLAVFDRLEPGDVLFIDSTHVVKTGGDVTTEWFEILPRIPPGVHIHLHDINYPFDYPHLWLVEQNRSWNETYFVRAFLMYNAQFGIHFWPDVLSRFGDRVGAEAIDLLGTKPSSIWLSRTSS